MSVLLSLCFLQTLHIQIIIRNIRAVTIQLPNADAPPITPNIHVRVPDSAIQSINHDNFSIHHDQELKYDQEC